MFISPEENNAKNTVERYEASQKNGEAVFFDVSEWIDIIEYYLDNMLYDNAKNAADTALEIYTASTELKITCAEAYLFSANTDLAEDIIQYLCGVIPDTAELNVLIGLYHSTLDHPKEAIEFFLAAYNDYEDFFRINVLLGDEYANEENYGLAIKYYQRAVLNEPTQENAVDSLVNMYFQSESYSLAEHFFEKLLNKDPYNAKIWHLLGVFRLKNEDEEGAIKAMEYATYISPSWAVPFFDMSEILFDQEKYKEAIDTIKRLLSVRTMDDPTPYSLIGKCYHEMGDFDSACEYFLKAIHYDPQLPEGWFNLASVHFAAGYKKQALDYIYQGIEADSTDIECLRLCWEIEESLQMWDDALSHLKEVINHPESNAEDYMDLAYFLYQRGDFQAALSVLQDTRTLYPEVNEVFYHMSAVYYALGNDEKGFTIFSKAISLEPDLAHVMQDNYPELVAKVFAIRSVVLSVDEGTDSK
ncbi:MAG: tetratricopeptide repeat protein [Flavobacteriales bacterium]|nr:tetratricopeptide repeat protein [Flavobacteriales bacterium]